MVFESLMPLHCGSVTEASQIIYNISKNNQWLLVLHLEETELVIYLLLTKARPACMV